MTTSKDVFAKRKAGQLDEAYQMALQRMGASDKDEWDDKAFGWCLIDLIKRDAKVGAQSDLPHYRQQLEAINVPESDEVLTKQRQFAISLCNPSGQLVNEARQLSKSGQHEQAAAIYQKLLRDNPSDVNISTSFGWELYRLSKVLLDKEGENLYSIKKNLNEYLKLNVEKPSLLHSMMLQMAAKFAGVDRFSMVAFSRLWGLENLRSDDWERFITDDKKELPALAERVIQQSSKEAAKSNDQNSLDYILPYLDKAVSAYSDNIWLSLNKAKVLLGLGRYDDSLEFALNVTKAKPNDYWTWELLGDISAPSNPELGLSCYCKALLCSSDDKFSAKVRIKLAAFLIERGLFAEAKYEFNRVLESKQGEGNKVPVEVENALLQPWYGETHLYESNEDFYLSKASSAEDLLLSQFSWIPANLGEVFTIPGKENKPRRKIYLQLTSGLEPVEVVVPESKLSSQSVPVGGGIQVKGEWDSQNRFQIYAINPRDCEESWDVFSERIAVVDHVNSQKKLIHFLVDRSIDGIVPFSDLAVEYKEGDSIAVRLSKYTTKDGTRFRVLSASKSESMAPNTVRREFSESVRITGAGFGFTGNDIFVPPNLVKLRKLQDGDYIKGVALLTFNKKRDEWGWKAVSLDETVYHKDT